MWNLCNHQLLTRQPLGGKSEASPDGLFGPFVHAVIFIPTSDARRVLPVAAPAVSSFHPSVSQFRPSTWILGAEWALSICSCGSFPVAVLWALVPKNLDSVRALRSPLFVYLPHDLGPFVLLYLLGELLLFAFHITGPVSIESVPLCVVSNADTHLAFVLLDWVVFFISCSSQFLSQASSLFPSSFTILSHLHSPCMFRNFEAIRRCSWKIIFASCAQSFLQVGMPCCPCLFQNLFIDTLWIFSHICSVTWTNISS